MDSNGLCDPYVKIKYGEQKAKTSTVFKSLNPVWMDCFIFTSPAVENEILLKIYDKDMLTNDFIGTVTISPQDIGHGQLRLQEKWYDIQASPKRKNAPSGKLRIVICPVGSQEDIEKRYKAIKNGDVREREVEARPWSIPLPDPPKDNFSALLGELFNDGLAAKLMSAPMSIEESRSLAILLLNSIPKHREQVVAAFRVAFETAAAKEGAQEAPFLEGPILQCASCFALLASYQFVHTTLTPLLSSIGAIKNGLGTKAEESPVLLALLTMTKILRVFAGQGTIPLDVIRIAELESIIRPEIKQYDTYRFISRLLLDQILMDPLELGLIGARSCLPEIHAKWIRDVVGQVLHEKLPGTASMSELLAKRFNLDHVKSDCAVKTEVDDYSKFSQEALNWASVHVLRALSRSASSIPNASILLEQYSGLF
eukprot:TRINITY_DN9723_c0_g1_i1.p1 TRINITY_DN9723_c0_g1~~TRINITY_DN9723_c0_g1_i1.p1  ORF type:complete len:454 (+),score=54.30 TRINITY_DN9723_c0_g1_i1:85-1362(+)